MGREPYLLPSIDRMEKRIWTRVFQFYLERSDWFWAYFPEDDELNRWEDEFLALPNVSVGEWEGMKDCKVVHGSLGADARKLFHNVHDPVDGRYPWQYELYRGTELLLRVEDFTLCHVFATREELQELRGDGIDTNLFERESLQTGHGTDEQPIPFSEEEVEDLRRRLSRRFNDKETS